VNVQGLGPSLHPTGYVFVVTLPCYSMPVPGWAFDLVSVGISGLFSVGTVILSGTLSAIVAIYTVDRRVNKERERRIEEWYIEAGIQSHLAETEWANKILSETKTGDPGAETLAERGRLIQEHVAEGRVLGADDSVLDALEQLAANFRYAATILEGHSSSSAGADLKELEDEMWFLLDVIDQNIPSNIEFDTDLDQR